MKSLPINSLLLVICFVAKTFAQSQIITSDNGQDNTFLGANSAGVGVGLSNATAIDAKYGY